VSPFSKPQPFPAYAAGVITNVAEPPGVRQCPGALGDDLTSPIKNLRDGAFKPLNDPLQALDRDILLAYLQPLQSRIT